MGPRWPAALSCLCVVAAAADPPPPPVRFTSHTGTLLADVLVRDTGIGVPVDRPGRKLKAAYGKAIALLSGEARTFDKDLDSARKAAQALDRALPEDGDMAGLLDALTAAFGADLACEAGAIRAGAFLADPVPRAKILMALDSADAAIAAAQSLRDDRTASRKLRGPRKMFSQAYAGIGGNPQVPGIGGVGIPGRVLGAGECFEATGTGVTFRALSVLPPEGPSSDSTYLIGGPFSKTNSTTVSGTLLWLFGSVDYPLGVPVSVDPDTSLLQLSLATFSGNAAKLDSLDSVDPGTGTVTFVESDPATGTLAATFDVTFLSGKSLSGSFRVSGLH